MRSIFISADLGVARKSEFRGASYVRWSPVRTGECPYETCRQRSCGGAEPVVLCLDKGNGGYAWVFKSAEDAKAVKKIFKSHGWSRLTGYTKFFL